MLLQPKLVVGAPNDVYEQEADRVAEQVMRMPEPKIQRVCPECEEELQRQDLPIPALGNILVSEEEWDYLLNVKYSDKDKLKKAYPQLKEGERPTYEELNDDDKENLRIHDQIERLNEREEKKEPEDKSNGYNPLEISF
jgi:hypothetical protein